MTSESELFIREILMPEVEEELERLGINFKFLSLEIPKEWEGIWDPLDFPEDGKCKIYDDDENVIGSVEFDVVLSGHIEAYPVNVKIKVN
ncbi:MAG: hypothetical protein ACTSQ8_17365 [Candidatus Helarchaeota archaeon]